LLNLTNLPKISYVIIATLVGAWLDTIFAEIFGPKRLRQPPTTP